MNTRVCLLLLISACRLSFELGTAGVISCDTTVSCPNGRVCVDGVGLCLDASASCIERVGDRFVASADGSECQLSDGVPAVCVSATCAPSRCGDGAVDRRSESCDLGAGNSATLPDTCRSNCQPARCGDGVVDTGEACDDGNAEDTDRCLATCIVNVCGDGVVNTLDEGCDDGNTFDSDACRNSCELNVCGDGVVNTSVETCDDANANPNDGCNACASTLWQAAVLAGYGSNGTSARDFVLSGPVGLSFDRQGSLFVVDRDAASVVRIDSASGSKPSATVVAGRQSPGPRPAATEPRAVNVELRSPSAISATPFGDACFIDQSVLPAGGAVRCTTDDGGLVRLLGDGNIAPATDDVYVPINDLSFAPSSLLVDGTNRLHLGRTHLVGDAQIPCLWRLDGSVVRRFVGAGALAPPPVGDSNPVDGGNADLGAGRISQMTLSPGRRILFVVNDDDGYGGAFLTDASDDNYFTWRVAGGGAEWPPLPGMSAFAISMRSASGVARGPSGETYVSFQHSAPPVFHGVIRIDDGVVTWVAGGTPGISAEGAVRGAWRFNTPSQLARDASGNVYLADTENHRIRVLHANGTMTTLAGEASSSQSPQPQQADTVSFNPPQLARMPNGSLVGCASDGSALLRMDFSSSHATLTRIAGDGSKVGGGNGGNALLAAFTACNGVAVNSAGVIYVSDNNEIRRIDANGVIDHVTGVAGSPASTGTSAATATFASASLLAVNGAGDLFVTDGTGSGCIRQIVADPTGAIVPSSAVVDRLNCGGTIWVGGLAVDSADRLFVTNANVGPGVRIDPGSSPVSIFLGGGLGFDGTPFASYSFGSYLRGVAFAPSGDMFVGCQSGPLYRIQAVGGLIGPSSPVQQWVGGGTRGPDGVARGLTTFEDIGAVAVDPVGAPVAVERPDLTQRGTYLRRVDAAGMVRSIAGPLYPPGDGPLANARLLAPHALLLLDDEVFLTDAAEGRVRRINRTSAVLDTVAGYPDALGLDGNGVDASLVKLLRSPEGLAFDAQTGLIYVSERGAHVVQRIDTRASPWSIANFAGTRGETGVDATHLNGPTALAIGDGFLYIADADNHMVRRIALSGGGLQVVAGQPFEAGFSGDGELATTAVLSSPQGITFDADGALFISDTGNGRIRRVTLDGRIESVLTGLQTPRALALDAYANLWFVDRDRVSVLAAGADARASASDTVANAYAPGATFPQSATRCLAGLAVREGQAVVSDTCAGLLIELRRQ